jgi:hypothetical protein
MTSKPTPPVVKVLKMILEYITNVQYFFKKEFITERYWKHFTYSLVFLFFITWLFHLYVDLADTGLFFKLFISGFLAFLGNFWREVYLKDKGVSKFSWGDVHFGSYGGIVGALIFSLLWQ